MSLRFVFAFAAALMFSAPAWSQASIESLDGQGVQRMLGDLGFTGSELDADDDVIVRMQGYRVLVLVGSNKGKSLMARFAVSGSKATLASMNEWNRTKQYSRAFLDADGDPVLESDLDLEGGVSEARVKDFLRTYNDSLRLFLNDIQ